MKIKLLSSAAVLLGGSLLAAHADLGDDITNAVTALSGQPNYSWKATVVVPADSQFKPGPTDGKTEKGGFTDVTTSMRDNTIEIASKGDKIAVNTPDNGWQSIADLESDQGPGRFMAMMARNSAKGPAGQAETLAASAASLKKDGDVISGDLTEAGAKAMLSFRPRGGGGGGPEISDAMGSVKFWITDGALTKFEFHVSGKMSFNGNDRDVDRDTTVEIKDVGTTKVTVPDEALKIIAPKPAADTTTK
jgi:hypothetical protein